MMLRLLVGLVATVLPLSAMAQERVLRAVLHADVRVIDPIWTTQTIANIHGALVYDTLFGNDADQKPQPQMVESTRSAPTGSPTPSPCAMASSSMTARRSPPATSSPR